MNMRLFVADVSDTGRTFEGEHLIQILEGSSNEIINRTAANFRGKGDTFGNSGKQIVVRERRHYVLCSLAYVWKVKVRFYTVLTRLVGKLSHNK